jgi:hypothetical protein
LTGTTTVTLGVMSSQREKLIAPALRLEISDTLSTPLSTSPISPTFRQRARALSQVALPTFRPSRGTASSTPSLLSSAPAPGITKAQEESQKLLAHVLEQLCRRPKCPPSNPMQSQAIPTAKLIIPLPSVSRANSNTQLIDPDGEDSSEHIFSPDLAFDLMNRLRDVLMFLLSHGWQLFNERQVSRERFECDCSFSPFLSTAASMYGGEKLDVPAPSSPFRLRRRSASIDTRHPSYSENESTELLSQCISVLQSIVSEDCRFPLLPRPSRPPNSLQAISLDIALLLVHMHAKSDTVVSQVGFALLPAFATFKPEMHPRLLSLFERILRYMLYEEKKLRSFANGNKLASNNEGA